MKIHQLLNKPTPTINDLAHKYQVSVNVVQQQLHAGIKVEMEHANDPDVAREIALDHLGERLDYYQQLAKIETPTQESTTRTSAQGAPGTLKAKISGKVTCDKVKALKSRKNATPHDKAQANWFINMHDCHESELKEVFGSPAQESNWHYFPEDGVWETNFNYQGNNIVVEMTLDDNQQTAAWVFGANAKVLPDNYVGYEIVFKVDRKTHATGMIGTHSVSLISQVIQTILGFLQTHKWDYVAFIGAEYSRNKLYQAISKKLAQRYNLDVLRHSHNFVVYKPLDDSPTQLSEIFREPSSQVSWRKFPNGMWETNFDYQGHNVVVEMNEYMSQDYARFVLYQNDLDMPSHYRGYNIVFRVDKQTDVTGQWGVKSVGLISRVLQVVMSFLENHNWDYVVFSGQHGSRNKLYAAMSEKLARQFHLKIATSFDDFVVYKPYESLQEIFRAPPKPATWRQDKDKWWTTKFSLAGHKVVIGLEPDDQIPQDYISYLANSMNIKIPEHYRGFNISFTVDDNIHLTGELGTISIKLLGKIVQLLRGFLSTHKWDYITFSGDTGSRNKLYLAMASKLAKEIGGKLLNKGSAFAIYKPYKSLDEAFDWKLPKSAWQVLARGDNYITLAFTIGGSDYEIDIMTIPKAPGIYDVVFTSIGADDPTGITGSGHAFKVFSAVKQMIDHARSQQTAQPMRGLFFTAKGASRQKLYAILAPKLAQAYGWKYTTDPQKMPYEPNPKFEKGWLIYDPKYLDETAGVGLVVPGVNMPAGMHKNEIQRQAKKFGFRVSPTGVPPLIRAS